MPWTALESHFAWYNRQAGRSRVAYQGLKVVQLLLAASLPVAGAGRAAVLAMTTLGAAVLVLESLQQLFAFHTNWISYRATAESLRREALLYSATAAPYSEVATRSRLLAERLAGIMTGESETWMGTQRTARATSASRSTGRAGEAP